MDDLPSPRRPWRGPISHKASQTSVYLQEWDISFEQVELGEPIGQGRWGRVHCGCWHGEVAIRLLEMHHHNQDHLKLFKKEVMNYWQMWHENVVLFMGACMNPPTWPSSPGNPAPRLLRGPVVGATPWRAWTFQCGGHKEEKQKWDIISPLYITPCALKKQIK